ncbi:MAG: hypothetical protein E6G37_00660 [Actinobacteria bacterium]|nr:MAG: hypothetical protein E6G37_00660 [Actinomycetota bacterium]
MVTAYPEHAALEAWSSVLSRARDELPETTLVMWFSDVRPTDLTDDVLTLAVPSPLVRERLQHNHLGLIEDAVASSYGGPVKIAFEVEEGIRHPLEEAPRASATTTSTAPSEAPTPPRPSASLGAPGLPFPNYTFEAFVPGPSNRFAHAGQDTPVDRGGPSHVSRQPRDPREVRDVRTFRHGVHQGRARTTGGPVPPPVPRG